LRISFAYLLLHKDTAKFPPGERWKISHLVSSLIFLFIKANNKLERGNIEFYTMISVIEIVPWKQQLKYSCLIRKDFQVFQMPPPKLHAG
jgi:hypothetical protein